MLFFCLLFQHLILQSLKNGCKLFPLSNVSSKVCSEKTSEYFYNKNFLIF